MMRILVALMLLVGTWCSNSVAEEASPATVPASIQAILGKDTPWQKVCEGSAPSRCTYQQRLAGTEGEGVLQIQLFYYANHGAMMRFITPPGVLLPPGVTVLVDDTRMGAPLLRCPAFGCYAQVELDAATAAQLDDATNVVVGFNTTTERTTGFPVSFKGIRAMIEDLRHKK